MPLIDAQWIQGALLAQEDCKPKDIEHLDLCSGDILVVISQSCDIVCESYDLEPYIEVHVGRAIEKSDGNNTHRKNPRILDLDTVVGSKRTTHRILAAERIRLPRKRLAKTLPVALLPLDDIYMLARWTGQRFTRPALPDEFNRRRKSARDRIAHAMKRSGTDISGIYIALNTEEELLEGSPYEVFVLGVVPQEVATDGERWRVSCEGVNSVVEALRCPGIEIVESETRSEADVSIDEIKHFARLELEYISERDGDSPAVEV